MDRFKTVSLDVELTSGLRYYHIPKNEDALDRYEKQVHRCCTVLEGQLAKTNAKSVLPGGVTAVDLHYYPWLRQGEFIGLSFEQYPSVQKWLANMVAIKEFNDAYDRLQESAKAEGAANADDSGKILGADPSLLRETAAGRM
jgi:glutathione S-transferase